MNEKRVTKREKFEMLKELVERVEIENADMLLEFIAKETAALEKKSGAKSKTQIANEAVIEEIFDALARVGRPVTISELQASDEAMGALSNQKISALMKKLKDAGRVVRTDDKKKAYFSIAE